MNEISILGCGWLGLPLANKLASLGYKVKGSTTSEIKLSLLAENGVEPFHIDLNKDSEAYGSFFESEILIITIPPSNTVRALDYFDQLERIKTKVLNGKIKHVLFISSSSVYENCNREVSETDASDDGLTRSGISLLKAENYFSSPENTILRFSGLVGNERNPGRWFAGKKDLKGGNVPVNMIHLVDCIGMIETIISGGHWGEIFNGCHPDHPLKKEYYPRLTSVLSLEPPQFELNDESDWKIISGKYFTEKTGYQYTRSIFDI